MDIVILFLLVLASGLMLFRAPPRAILATWIVAAILIAGLFQHHATSALDLSF